MTDTSLTALALELHDIAALALAAGEGTPRAAVPAVVRLDGRNMLVGEAAVSEARILPKQVQDRFWHELSLAPLEPPFPATWRVADLAHAHLEEVWRLAGAGVEEVLLAVGGALAGELTGELTGEPLGLALGIAQSLGIPVGGVVDAALAATAFALEPSGETSGETSWLHLDLFRHSARATSLARDGDQLVITTSRDVPGLGHAAFFASYVDAAARAFVRSTRLDPLGSALGEQHLVDRLPHWLDALATAKAIDARLEIGGETAAIELTRQDLLHGLEAKLERLADLVDHASGPVLLSSHAACLGVEPALARRGARIRRLGADAACRGALAHRQQLVSAGPRIQVMRLSLATGSGRP